MGFRVQGLGFGARGLGVSGLLGFRGLGLLGFRVWGGDIGGLAESRGPQRRAEEGEARKGNET